MTLSRFLPADSMFGSEEIETSDPEFAAETPLPDFAPLDIWVVTTGEAGMRSQAMGLAARLGGRVTEKVVGLRAPWSLFSPGVIPRPLLGQARGRDRLEAPWPDVLISCGRRAAALALGVGAASGGRTVTAHIQNPRGGRDAFDLVIAMEHDRVAGPNTLSVATALHRVTPAGLRWGMAWEAHFARLPRPLVGVLVGGSTRQQVFTADHARELAAGLKRLHAAGYGVAITPSRRTPRAVTAILADAVAGDRGVYLWDGEGENPYMGILALSQRLVATSDSVSMISEALAACDQVEVFDLGARRHQRFLQPLVDSGYVRRFTGDPSAPQPRQAPDAGHEAERALRRVLYARTGWSG